MNEVLTIEAFLAELADYWGLSIPELDVAIPLEDLGIDSIGKLELIVMLEELGGNELPEELWGEGITLADIYATYEVYASRDQGDLSGT